MHSFLIMYVYANVQVLKGDGYTHPKFKTGILEMAKVHVEVGAFSK